MNRLYAKMIKYFFSSLCCKTYIQSNPNLTVIKPQVERSFTTKKIQSAQYSHNYTMLQQDVDAFIVWCDDNGLECEMVQNWF